MTTAAPAILVVGSANVDLIVRSDRLPGPGETVVGGDFLTAGGGKGANQAIAASRLGARVAFVGRVGDDSNGRFARESFEAAGIDLTGLEIDPAAPTGVALILVDRHGQNLIAVASGANGQLTPRDIQRAAASFRAADVLIVQLEVPLEAVQESLELAKRAGLTTVLNPAPARQVPDQVLILADWLTPNENEAEALTGVSVTDAASAADAGRILLGWGVAHVVITRGSSGAIYLTRDSIEEIRPFAVEAIDTVAAGDAFTAGLAVSLARGKSARASLDFASAAGALTTTRRGAQPALPTLVDVERLVASRASSAQVG